MTDTTVTPTLRQEAEGFFSELRARTTDRVDPCLQLLGVGEQGILRGFERLETRVRHTVLNMQRSQPFHVHADYADLNARSYAHGLTFRVLASTACLDENPLLSSTVPGLYVGPVFGPMIIADGQCVVVAGAPDLAGRPTAWLSVDRSLVARGRHLWDRTLALARPAVPPGEEPPLSRRQLDVARLMVGGHTDRVIARRLEVSERTVAADVRRIVGFVGAVNRSSAVARISGAPRRTTG